MPNGRDPRGSGWHLEADAHPKKKPNPRSKRFDAPSEKKRTATQRRIAEGHSRKISGGPKTESAQGAMKRAKHGLKKLTK